MQTENPYNNIKKTLTVDGQEYHYYSLLDLNDERVAKLPISIRVLLECAIRNCDEFAFKKADVEKILDWQVNAPKKIEIPFKPSRVLLQDFTGVPAVVDLAAMRDAIVELGSTADKITPQVPVDLVIDHSVQVDHARIKGAWKKNEEIEMKRNRERFEFLKWGQQAFENFKIVPPGSGIVHQVNLEYLGRVVFAQEGLLYPDSLVGTDSHSTMINGLGIVGWGVGGIEAEATMLGQQISMVLPEVVGVKLTGKLPETSTATDLVLTVTNLLRQRGCVGKFVEFFGPGVATLSLPDRATLSNMAPEFGATMSFFPVDDTTVDYLKLTGRDEKKLKIIQAYLKAQGLYRDYTDATQDTNYSGDILEVNLDEIEACVAGPKRPQDKVKLSTFAEDFKTGLTNPVGFKGFGYAEDKLAANQTITYQGKEYNLHHGSLVIAAITSCTNTSNPGVMIAAGVIAKRAAEKGLTVKPYIKTSLAPGSKVVTEYLNKAGLTPFLDQIGFTTAGYGCTTCIGNSGDIPPEVAEAIKGQDLCVAAILSGNRNFEGRVHSLTKANYLASPPLVVTYALAGRVDLDLAVEPLGTDTEGNPVFMKDLWPTRTEINEIIAQAVTRDQFEDVYANITKGSKMWQELEVTDSKVYGWKDESTYIHRPPFFLGMTKDLPEIKDIEGAYCLVNVGDSVTTDHISPAGKIATVSPAAKFLQSLGVAPKDFNTYGARRGNDLVMARGTFANIRLKNKLVNLVEGPHTKHVPTDKKMPVYDAAALYQEAGHPLIILAGKEYGTGSSRDWAAKGPYLQGVKVVVAESYERIHRSNLVGMGILPLQFKDGENADSLGLTGFERFTVKLNGGDLKCGQDVEVAADSGVTFTAVCRLDTDPEVGYYRNGGILQNVLRDLAKQ